jgi:hypothetical protein
MTQRASIRAGMGARIGAGILLGLLALFTPVIAESLSTGKMQAEEKEEIALALSLAKMLQSARSVISRNQDLINDPERGDKGLTGDVVLAAAIDDYKKETSQDPIALDPASRQGRLLRAQMAAIKEVMDENQALINQKGLGFKGFIPATFARLVTERLKEKAETELSMKVTAPPELVRNRKSRPDQWERNVIESKFRSPTWKRGEIFYQRDSRERDAFRVMVPEYYSTSCLSCHGGKKGEIDITGYPKEGAKDGDLGGVISMILYPSKQ